MAEAAVLSFNVFSAASGFDVPSGLSPLTQLHPNEMVLPADLANTVRANNAAGDGGSSQKNLSINVTSMDSRDVLAMFNNPVTLRGLIKKLQTAGAT